MPRCQNPRCQVDYPAGITQCTNPFCQCLLPEAIVAGRYRIETLIGIGGMGAVYRVSDTFEMEQVALKVLTLNPRVMDRETAVERFRREARYAHQLKHKNIVTVLNFGQDGELLYLVMPLITGGTLKAVLKAEHPLPMLQAQRYLNDLAEALDAIHAHPQQIIHRDIKPSNLLIHQDDGRLVLADFGIARAMQQEKALTQRGWSLGTEHYMAPEQEHGNPEPASDIYAMGVVAYQMFSGLLPFQAVVKSRATELPAPSKLNPTLPSSVDAVILRAIDIDPQKRFSSAGAFAKALNSALASEAPTVLEEVEDIAPTLLATSDANVIVRTIIPENPCSRCGRENRSTSRFCRHCGQSLDDTSPLVSDMCQIGYGSDRGQQAQINEDTLLVVQGLCVNLALPPRPFSLFAVADGLKNSEGATDKGQEASKLAIETIADVLIPLLVATTRTSTHPTPHQSGKGHAQTAHTVSSRQRPSEAVLEQWLASAVQQANRVIYHCNADFDRHMASTLTVALIYKHRLYVASVGDSRAYRYTAARGLQCVTRDHTLAAQLVDAQLLKPDDVYTSSKRHRHYRMIGQNYQTPVDIFQLEVEPGDLVLLCTDGLWHMMRDEQIATLLNRQEDPQRLVEHLLESANRAGGEGNISAIVVRVQ